MRPSLTKAKSMSDIERYLKDKGYHLARSKRHNVWKNGSKTIVLPSSGAKNGHAFRNYVKMVEKQA